MRREAEDTKKVTIRVYTSDIEWLKEAYPHVGYNAAIRTIVRNHRRNVEERVAKKLSQAEMEND